MCITLSNVTERGGPQNKDPLLCTLTQQQKRQERSFEQGVKRFSCLIQPPRKLSKTKDPSSRLLLHACVVNVVRTENEAISQILLFFRTFCSYKNGCRYVASTFEMTPLSWIQNLDPILEVEALETVVDALFFDTVIRKIIVTQAIIFYKSHF